MARRGPKPKYGKPRTVRTSINMTEEQRQFLAAAGAGTVDVMLRWLLERAEAQAIESTGKPGALSYQVHEIEVQNDKRE